MYRSSGDQSLEDPGHFGDAWIGFAWQPKGPVSARVTSCIACHSQGQQLGNIDLVEASLRLDVNKCLCPNNNDALSIKANIEAGRFVVPFGAYYQEVNPGVDRAVSRPLIYNMGQRVYPNSIGDPVLPMPYSDEGASLNLTIPLSKSIDATLNTYAVNGLEGGITASTSIRAAIMSITTTGRPWAGGRPWVGRTCDWAPRSWADDSTTISEPGRSKQV